MKYYLVIARFITEIKSDLVLSFRKIGSISRENNPPIDGFKYYAYVAMSEPSIDAKLIPPFYEIPPDHAIFKET